MRLLKPETYSIKILSFLSQEMKNEKDKLSWDKIKNLSDFLIELFFTKPGKNNIFKTCCGKIWFIRKCSKLKFAFLSQLKWKLSIKTYIDINFLQPAGDIFKTYCSKACISTWKKDFQILQPKMKKVSFIFEHKNLLTPSNLVYFCK